LWDSNGLRRSALATLSIFASSDADGRARAKAATRTVGGGVGVERHRVAAFTTLRARLAVQRAAAQPRFHVLVGDAELADACRAAMVGRSAASCQAAVGPYHSAGNRQEEMGDWVLGLVRSSEEGCLESGCHDGSSEDREHRACHLLRARSVSRR